MNGLNDAFFFVINKIIDLQSFFIKEAWAIGRTVFIIALLTAILNYAISGSGFKDNMVKLAKATAFFFIIMFAYPKIIGYITAWTFDRAYASTFTSMENYLNSTKNTMADAAIANGTKEIKESYGSNVMKSETVSEDKDPLRYFNQIIIEQNHNNMAYTTVSPAALLRVVLLIAGECMRFSDDAPKKVGIPDFGAVIKGMVCAFFVILTGVFAVLEYLMAFMEFILISSVGIILFPLSLWEGSRFMSEKFVGAIVGFFMKLLFCNIAIFLMLYGFISLSKQFVTRPFSGLPDEIVMVIFTCLLFFYICKSAPGLAQSLLTGTPSLSATGAISAVGGAIGAAAATAGMAKSAGGAIAGGAARGAAKAVFGGGGAIAQAAGAAGAVKELGGGKGATAGAFMKSMAGSAGEALKTSGGELARSLIGGKGGGGGTGAGINKHSQTQKFLGEKNEDGTKKTFAQHFKAQHQAGQDKGIDQMAKKEAQQNQKKGS